MINRKAFFTKLYEKITDAIKQCDEGNVIDLRLFKNNNCLGDGVFSIFEGEELYNEVKDCDTWFVDFYENIKGENCAEFVDIVLWSDEFAEETEDTPKTMNVEEFDAKWGEMPNRSEMDFETELEFIEDCFNMYETSGFSATYHSIGIDEKDFNGVAFQVIGRASYKDGDCDLEQLPMWHIEFEDGTKHMAFPEEITKIERERQTLAQKLHKEEEKPINQTNTMDRYEQIRNKLESFASEDELVRMWNEYVEEHMETETENIKFYLNNTENILDILSNMSQKGIAESIAQSSYACYNSMDRYVYEMSDRLYSTNSIFATTDTDALERFYSYLMKNNAREEWEKASEDAITLWYTPNEEVRVEITSKWVKFFRRDDIYSAYTYPALSVLKKDREFLQDCKDCLLESCQFNADEWNNWIMGTCDMPPFPISVIFHCDYNKYEFYEFEDSI